MTATRYTTDHVIGGTFDRLLWAVIVNPGAPAAALVAEGSTALRLGARVTVVAAGIGYALGFSWWFHRRHLALPARLQRAMTELGLGVRSTDGVVVGPSLRRRPLRTGRNAELRWTLPPGVTLRDVLDRQEALEHQCNCELRCWMEDGVLHTEVLGHKVPAHVDFRRFYGHHRPHGRLLIGLGKGRRGALWADLSALPHLLVGGMTGGGKSVFLRQALTHLALENSPKRLWLVLHRPQRGRRTGAIRSFATFARPRCRRHRGGGDCALCCSCRTGSAARSPAACGFARHRRMDGCGDA